MHITLADATLSFLGVGVVGLFSVDETELTERADEVLDITLGLGSMAEKIK